MYDDNFEAEAVQKNSNFVTHTITPVGEGELAWCERCKGGEVELYEATCDERVRQSLRKLVVHCKRTKYDVYIGRGRCPQTEVYGKWGNPFSHLPTSAAQFRVATREEAVAKYREWLLAQPHLVERAKRELKGKVLGCWCAPQSCHGDVLAEIANA